MDPTTLLSTIAITVKERRGALGLTQKQLASIAGVSERLVRLIETEQAPRVGIENLALVLAPLGLELSLEGEGPRVGSRSVESDVEDNDEYEQLLLRAVASWGGAGHYGEGSNGREDA